MNSGTLVLTGCTVSSNRTGRGGSSTLTYGADAGLGGGIRNENATATLTNSTVSGNQGGPGGDGCECRDMGNGDIICMGAGRGGEGGGMANEASTVTIVNSTFAGNASGASGMECTVAGTMQEGGIAGNGGAILTARSTMNVSFSTFVGNITQGAYGGGGVSIFFGTTTLKGTVLFGNASTNGSPDCFSYGYNTTSTSLGYNVLGVLGSCGLSGPVPTVVADARLGALADNGGPTATMAPTTTSPLIDAVPAANCTDAGGNVLSIDQRFLARPLGGKCDIGAVELK